MNAYWFMQLYCDVPSSKKAKTDEELEEELSSKDVGSFESSYVWVAMLVYTYVLYLR